MCGVGDLQKRMVKSSQSASLSCQPVNTAVCSLTPVCGFLSCTHSAYWSSHRSLRAGTEPWTGQPQEFVLCCRVCNYSPYDSVSSTLSVSISFFSALK